MKKVICLVMVIIGLMMATGASALFEPWTTDIDFPGYEIYVQFMYRLYESYWKHDCYEEIIILKNQYNGTIDTAYIICKDLEGNVIDGALTQDADILGLVNWSSPSGTVLNFNAEIDKYYEDWTVWVY